MLGLVAVGIVLGGALAAVFVSNGGSLLTGFVIFSLVGTFVALAAAMSLFMILALTGKGKNAAPSRIQVAE